MVDTAFAFGAIVHVDVTCWIRQKLSVPRACRSALGPGGIMAFTAIEPASGLTPAERRRVADVGPPEALVRTSHPSLLDSAGFVDVAADGSRSAPTAS